MSPLAIEGLYAVTPDEPDSEVLRCKVRSALAGGARLLQYRNKAADARLRRAQGAALLALCREAGVPLVVNDDVDLMLAIGADGVHLGRGDADLAGARAKLPEGALIGASCYASLDLARAARSAGASYVAFGSAFPSATKPGASPAPLSLYRGARERLDCPIVAIGGITPENGAALVEAGVHAIAVISALFDAPDIERRARDFAKLFPRRDPETRGRIAAP
ncbi:MAG: thiamine phosphate synthase [Burkholderiales bacterium]